MTTICTGGEPMLGGGSDGGIMLPLVKLASEKGPQPGPMILYAIGLLWCFHGVGIISDIFMCAIEKITSAKKQITVMVWDDKAQSDKKQHRTVKVWNDTVANLTLMALGSSAPEIILGLIELLPENMHAGKLGPSTIVGSAAFNLLIITAVCISAIPAKEERKIKDLSVFSVTATFSIFAYLWMIFVLAISSPHIVDVWEAVLTILFLPLLVVLAYLADIGWFHKLGGGVKATKRLVFSPETTKEELDMMLKILKEKYPKLPDDSAKRGALLHYEFPKNASRAVRRIEATRGMTGNKQTRRDDHYILGEDLSKEYNPNAKGRVGTVQPVNEDESVPKGQAIFEHASPIYAVSESSTKVTLTVKRDGNTEDIASCKYRTMDGTAKGGEDYEVVEGKLEFQAGQKEKTFEIKILEDQKHESTEEFYVELIPIPNSGILGFTKIATIVVLDSDSPGLLRFENENMNVLEPANKTAIKIPVSRINGAFGEVKCAFRTEDASAKAGMDYEEAKGELTFLNGVMEATIEVEILPVATVDKRMETFRLILEPCEDDEEGGTKFDERTDGGAESCILTITIDGTDTAGDKRFNAIMTAAAAKDWVNWDNVAIGRENWKAQFIEALYINGGEDDAEAPGPLDWFFHIISLPWKLLFAIVPPVDFCGGWLCFFCALIMIGVCTALIGDLANLLGCALNMKAELCAVTIVALGTSLPDTFASKTAACQDPTADNSVGNVTGSNSVNVFLGLGLQWLVGSAYWTAQGVDITMGTNDPWIKASIERGWDQDILNRVGIGNAAFVVPAGSLTGSVGVFCCCACSCLALLAVRRKVVGAELGGNVRLARMSSCFLVFLWLFYVGMAVYFAGDIAPYE